MGRYLVLLLIATSYVPSSARCEDIDLAFPDNFKVGAAVSSYQIEGAWNASDKGENVWDRFTHLQPSAIFDETNGDIACDSYHKYKEDVQWLKTIGLDHYRFSISWSRILPTGFMDKISEDGLKYYHNLIDELLLHGIEPIVTIYHWDHPQVLEDMGGWMNEMMVNWFGEYARLIYREFGSKVKTFTTLNEPQFFCSSGYGNGHTAPGKIIYGGSKYLCGHNALKAHARAYRIYDTEFRSEQGGKVGITVVCDGFLSKNSEDAVSVDTAFQFDCGWMAHPIFKGDYPEIMKTKLAMSSEKLGFPESILPKLSDYWIQYINGTTDYFGLNHYTTRYVEPAQVDIFDTFRDPTGLKFSVDDTWQLAESPWIYVVPEGIGNVLRKIKYEYDNPAVYIMENGFSDAGGVNDHRRVKYLYSYMKEVLISMKRDQCNVQKYTIWSFLDNFEWNHGYAHHFGLISVNFSSPSRERSPKLSTAWLIDVLRTRNLQSLD